MSELVQKENLALYLDAVTRFKRNIRGCRPEPGDSRRTFYDKVVAGGAMCSGGVWLFSVPELLLGDGDADYAEVCRLFPWIPLPLLETCNMLFHYLALADAKDWSSRCLDAMASASEEDLRWGYWEFVIWCLNDPDLGLRPHMEPADLPTLDAAAEWALGMACGETAEKPTITTAQKEFAWRSYVRFERRDAIKALEEIDGGLFVFYLAETNRFCFNYHRLKSIAEKLIEFIKNGAAVV